MIGIEECVSYIPENRVDNLEKNPHLTEQSLDKLYGVRYLAQHDKGETAATACMKALKNLHQKKAIDHNDIDLIVVVSQHSQINIPPASTEVHGLGDFPEKTVCFDLSLGCTGYVQGLAVTLSYMKAMNLKRALFFAVETFSDIPTNSSLDVLMGDAASVTLLSEDAIFDAIDFSSGTQGKLGLHLKNYSGQVKMDGAGVYEFVIRFAPKNINQILQKNNLTLNDMDFFAFHQASKRTVDSLSRTMKIPPEKGPFLARDYGNTGSCSIPLLLEKEIHEVKNNKIFIGAFGAGMAWANGILIRRADTK